MSIFGIIGIALLCMLAFLILVWSIVTEEGQAVWEFIIGVFVLYCLYKGVTEGYAYWFSK